MAEYKVTIRRDDKFENITLYNKEDAYFIFHRMQEVALNPNNYIDELILEENDSIIEAIRY